MTDLVVVGAGFWGTAVALEARRRGLDTLLLDDGDPHAGTRNAALMCQPWVYTSSLFGNHWPRDWPEPKVGLEQSFQWVIDHFPSAEWVDTEFQNLMTGSAPRDGRKVIRLSQWPPPSAAPVPWGVTEIKQTPDNNWELRGPGLRASCPRVVLACGYRADELLVSAGLPTLGVDKLRGRGMLVRAAEGRGMLREVREVLVRPFTKYMVRKWAGGNLYHVGDTAGEAGTKELEKVATAVLGEGWEQVHGFDGFRPVLPKYTVKRVAPGLVVATGGYRMALGLSGLVACRALEMVLGPQR